jgi:hypothetical protein
MGTASRVPSVSWRTARKAKGSTADAVGPPTTAKWTLIDARRNFTAVGVAVRDLLRRKRTSRWQFSCPHFVPWALSFRGADMKQRFAWIGLVFLFVVPPLAFSQDGTPQPCPDVEPGALGCEPVAWSRLQEPTPLPEPDAKPAPSRDPQAGQSSNSPAQPQTPKQSITGIIVKQGEKYVLKAGDNTTYQLDDQSSAAQYQGKQVKVVGILDADNNTLHIEGIELAS